MINFDNIPNELKTLPNWVLWRYEMRNGKRTKVPYSPDDHRRAESNNPSTWGAFDKVAKVPDGFDGVGFMLGNSPYIGIDLDYCFDGDKKEDAAYEIIKNMGTYAELSVSGGGVHMIGKASLERGRRPKHSILGEVEIYPAGRFFTMTGDSMGEYKNIVDIQAPVNALIAELEASKSKPKNTPRKTVEKVISASAAEIINRIRCSKQGELFSALYDKGDTSPYDGDDSRADMALASMLPFWTGGDLEQMEEIFNGSELAARDKWQNRPDYRERTLQKALDSWDGRSWGGLLDYPLTDYGNAERLQYTCGDSLIYVAETDKWYTWDGKRWAKSPGKEPVGLYETVADIMRDAHKQARSVPMADEKTRAAYMNYFRKAENTSLIRNCITFARSLFLTELTKLDNDPLLLNCQNGTINLKTGVIYPHNKADFITMVCNADYDPGAKSPEWERTLQEIMPDNEVRAWMQKFMGYCLYGLTSEEKFLFAYGPGGSGKGTLFESIAHVLGDYAGAMDIDTILTSRNDAGDGGQATPQIAGLAGKRLIITSESGAGRKFNSARIKLITGGDKLTARFLHGNPFEFYPQFTLIMSSNFKPALTDATDDGMKRRLVIVPFNSRFDNKDVHLKQRLRTAENKAAILAWCVEGAREWWTHGLGEMPQAVKRILADYYEDQDILGMFLDECCVVEKDARVKVRELLESFNFWLTDCQVGRNVTQRTFSEQMQNRGFRKHKYTSGAHFDGVRLKTEEDRLADNLFE